MIVVIVVIVVVGCFTREVVIEETRRDETRREMSLTLVTETSLIQHDAALEFQRSQAIDR